MRLTLRTLLAWLDDTLSPSEVREIGKQVAESPFAKDLVDKIHLVTRQRRLTVPPTTGPDAIDPNVVASYLDNELDPEQVAELEKKCLVSDVHLSEVTSVHQILSLIGQKAKVPVEARHRMYQLIRGPEAVRPQGQRASKQTEPQPVSEPVPPWVTVPPPTRPWYERFGPVAVVVGLMAILWWTAWKTLSPPESSPHYSRPLAQNHTVAPAPVPNAAAPGAGANAVADNPGAAQTTPKATEGDKPTPEKAPSEKDQAKDKAREPGPDKGTDTKPEKTASDVPPGSAGLAKKPGGMLLRFNPERRDWERVTEATPLREQDRLLSLAPFRAPVEIGTAGVDLVGETEVWVRSTPPNLAARLSLAQGRVVLHGRTPSLPFEILFGSKTVTLTPPPGGAVGVERLNRRAPGEPMASASVLRVFTADGPLKVSAARDETIDGAGGVTVEPDGALSDSTTKAAPAWVNETKPPQFDQKIGEQFLKFFRPDRPIVSSLVEASEDEQKDVCRLAISALRAVGDISYIVPLLNKKGDPTAPTARRAAIAVLRSYLTQGPDAGRALREQLRRDLGNDLAAVTEKLIVGYTPKEAGEEATYAKLVQLLGNTDPGEVGVRELALDNLMTLTGRDDIEYDPEQPEGKGLKAWRDLLRDHDLKPATAAKGEK